MRNSRRFAFLEQLESRAMLAADMAPDEILIQFNPHVADQAKAAVIAALSGHIKENIHTPAMSVAGDGDLEVVSLPPGLGIQNAIDRVKNTPAVLHAEPNFIFHPLDTPNDTYYTSGSLWGMYGDSSTPANAYGSQAAEVWAQGNTGSRSVAVGIVDEGIDYSHPDLAANIWTNPGEIAGDGIDNDGDGYVDDIHGWDFANNDNTIFDGTPSDNVDHHGTHVAGTIAGVGGNGTGVAGVTWSTQLISAKFLGPSGGYLSDAVKALDYLTMLKTKYGVNIVASNNSWGGGGYSSTLQDAITRAANAGILFVAAAGNGGSDGVGDDNDVTANYPSNYDTTSGSGFDSVIAVAAIDKSGNLASFSNYGSTTVDLGAPGVGIVSTLPFNSYGSYSGTSMATPHVTGAVALYAASHPGANALTLKNAVLDSARATPTASLSGKTVTGGRLNASAMPDYLPTLSINDASIIEGNSGTANLVFTVLLSKASTQTVTVDFSTSNGTATAGTDYVAAAGTLTFASGLTSQTVIVPVLGDTLIEGNETVYVNLANASGSTLADFQGQGTIVDDDVPLPTVSIGNVTASEGQKGNTKFVFTVSLSNASSKTVTVPFATANGTAIAGSDYRATSGTLSFSPGVKSLSVTVLVSGDKTIEPDETFFLNLGQPTNAVLSSTQGQGVGTIVNDDGALTVRSADVGSSEQQGSDNSRLDVNLDGVISAMDVLTLINDINAHGPNEHALAAVASAPAAQHDVSGDGFVTALDVMLIVNFINAHGSQAASQPVQLPDAIDVTDLLIAGASSDLSLLE
jgi:hypothetical protein